MAIINQTIENYLKCIYALSSLNGEKGISTNAIAERLETKASSVTDMLKKLSRKGLIDYKKYHGASLTVDGSRIALTTLRKHRLWEVFLVKELDFEWNEVHEIAEQLEHIDSQLLIDRLDQYLGHPKFDPHGDPIPDADGNMTDDRAKIQLTYAGVGMKGKVVGVADSSDSFLEHLGQLGIGLGVELEVRHIAEYDGSMRVALDQKEINISEETASNILIVQK